MTDFSDRIGKVTPEESGTIREATPEQAALFDAVRADVEAMDWRREAVRGWASQDWEEDARELRDELAIAVANAILNRNEDGFQIKPLAVVIVGNERFVVLLKELPPEGYDTDDLVANLWDMLRHYQASRVLFGFVASDPSETIGVLMVKPGGFTYIVRGRVEDGHFVRDVLTGFLPRGG